MIFLVFIIIILVSIICIFKPIPKKSRSITLVVSRFNENLEWLKEAPFNEYPVVIYNKGSNDNFTKTDKVRKVINLPNVGREAHTYLYHVISHYDTLDDITFFVPGSADLWYKQIKAKHVIKNANKLNDSVYYCEPGYNVQNQYNFSLDSYETTHKSNKTTNNTFLLSSMRPFGKWYEQNIDGEQDCVGYHAIFAASKKDIIKNPIEYYKNLIKYCETHPNPEVSHYLERTWSDIFNMEPHSKKSLYSILFSW